MTTRMLWVAFGLLAAGCSPVAPNARSQQIEIPLRFEDGRLIVPVEASDGTQLEFILSTSSTSFSRSTVGRFGDQPELTIGGVPVYTEGVQTVSDEELAVRERVMDGMIGPQTLNQYDVLIDVPEGQLVLQPIRGEVEWEGVALSLPMRVRVLHGLLTVAMLPSPTSRSMA